MALRVSVPPAADNRLRAAATAYCSSSAGVAPWVDPGDTCSSSADVPGSMNPALRPVPSWPAGMSVRAGHGHCAASRRRVAGGDR